MDKLAEAHVHKPLDVAERMAMQQGEKTFAVSRTFERQALWSVYRVHTLAHSLGLFNRRKRERPAATKPSTSR